MGPVFLDGSKINSKHRARVATNENKTIFFL